MTACRTKQTHIEVLRLKAQWGGYMDKLKEHITYYEQQYRLTAEWVLRPSDRMILGDKHNRRCRFCGRSKPDVTFRMDAHALPECIGNKGLLTFYECDECNRLFGHGCENDFGNWSLPMRTMARISGKDGIPSIKQGPGNAWRVDEYPTGLTINVDETEGFWRDDVANCTLSIQLKRGPYRPAGVAQAFFKMALSVMPEAELPNFRELLDWMKPGTVQKMAAPTPLLHTFTGGAWPRDLLRVAVLTRVADEMLLPYCFFILGYGNEMFQVAIPSSERDRQHFGRKMTIPTFPFCGDPTAAMSGTVRKLELYSDEVVKDDKVEITLSYGSRADHALQT